MRTVAFTGVHASVRENDLDLPEPAWGTLPSDARMAAGSAELADLT
jgi:hypothetical protein